MQTIADPRVFPLVAGASVARWHACAELALSAATGEAIDAAENELRQMIVASLRARDFETVRAALDTACSAVIHRHVLRALRNAWTDGSLYGDSSLAAHPFAIPVVIVAAADAAVELTSVIEDVEALVAMLREHRCLGSNQSFALANVLAGGDAVGLDSLARWLDWRDAGRGEAQRDIAPLPIRIACAQQGAHLRYIVGSALASAGARPFPDGPVGAWAIPFARELSRQLAAPGVQLLALPRPPADPLGAMQLGQRAHREVGLQLFASDAIRTVRAMHGEPTAVISAHRIGDQGELRVSLSSVFGEREAEGFRCPLFAFDRIDDVLAMIVDLLRECRVEDIRVLGGIHPGQDARTCLPLFFRADAIGRGDSVPFH